MDGTSQSADFLTYPWPDDITSAVADLRDMSRGQLKRLFHCLPVPEMHEFVGEMKGVLLDQGNAFANALTRRLVNRGGTWLGKGFVTGTDPWTDGYNIYQKSEGTLRTLQMQLHRHQSEYEDRLSIEYYHRQTGLVGRISDDMKRVCPGVFLGLGHVPFFPRLTPKLSRRVMFALVGPVAPGRPDAVERDVLDQQQASRAA